MKTLNNVSYALLLGSMTMLNGCIDSDSDNDKEVIKQGVFLDSAVQGFVYKTATQSGETSLDGSFNYKLGEKVTFSIGDLNLPVTSAKAVLTPVDLFGSGNVDDEKVMNLVRLLMSIDSDSDPSNGISISEAAHTAATGLDIDFSSTAFDTQDQVVNFVANAGGDGLLVSEADANTHFKKTLINDVALINGKWDVTLTVTVDGCAGNGDSDVGEIDSYEQFYYASEDASNGWELYSGGDLQDGVKYTKDDGELIESLLSYQQLDAGFRFESQNYDAQLSIAEKYYDGVSTNSDNLEHSTTNIYFSKDRPNQAQGKLVVTEVDRNCDVEASLVFDRSI